MKGGFHRVTNSCSRACELMISAHFHTFLWSCWSIFLSIKFSHLWCSLSGSYQSAKRSRCKTTSVQATSTGVSSELLPFELTRFVVDHASTSPIPENGALNASRGWRPVSYESYMSSCSCVTWVLCVQPVHEYKCWWHLVNVGCRASE